MRTKPAQRRTVKRHTSQETALGGGFPYSDAEKGDTVYCPQDACFCFDGRVS